jgi:NitT/TauT family transport system substrate-binding protein
VGFSFASYGTAGGSGFLAQNSVRVMQLRFPVRALALVLLAAMVSFAVPGPAGAQSGLTEITFGILTPTAAEWPLYLAETQGFYKDEGLTVTMVNGSSPPNVINMVSTNAVNIADNGCDSEFVAIAHGLPVKIIAPMFTVNPYSLVVLPSVKTWADLKGKSVMLGTKQDVTAIALGSLAAAHNLKLDDFQIVVGGNSTARYAGLASGNVQGAMLTQPFDLLAESKGDTILATASDTIKDWVFTCVVTNNDWAAKNRPLVAKFLRALRKGIQYGYAHKDAAVAALVSQTHTDPAIAARAWDIDFGKWKAFDPNLKLSPSAVQTVGKYQVQFGIIPALPPMKDLYDPSFAADALK